ncbi:hypothetical protein RND71_043990 [Anisodus tanguticus]|uniref:60S acidic ribosomal protein P2 n=1 Tax=Anisodus tanguticus TaxID=243964 RepID=A0AAE1QRI1_9SOLA|nr:hypothetical protein RND71_043990 [Anisodus tanguticus]
MRYLAAYLLLRLGNNSSPSLDDVKKVLGSVGVDVDDAKAQRVIKELNGKNIEEVIAEGTKKLATVPSGGGAAPAAASAAAPASASNDSKKDAKKEEAAEESEEDDMAYNYQTENFFLIYTGFNSIDISFPNENNPKNLIS